MPRLGMQRKPLSRTALRKLGLETDHDVTMVQTGGQAETVMVMAWQRAGARGCDHSAGN